MMSILMILTILSMVAEVVFCVDPSSSSSSDNVNGATVMSKAFATSTKLTETNYMIWYAGLLTVLLGVTVAPYNQLMALLEFVQAQLHHTMDALETSIGAMMKNASFKQTDGWKVLDKVMFNVIYWTVDETIPGLKS